MILFVPFIIAALILLEGISRLSQFPKPNIMGVIWLVVGIILVILAILGSGYLKLA